MRQECWETGKECWHLQPPEERRCAPFHGLSLSLSLALSLSLLLHITHTYTPHLSPLPPFSPHLDLCGSDEQPVVIKATEVLLASHRPVVLASSILQLHTNPFPRGKVSVPIESTQERHTLYFISISIRLVIDSTHT